MHYLSSRILTIVMIVSSSLAMAQQKPQEEKPSLSIDGILIPATTTMTTAWDIPRDPMTDSSLQADPLGAEIRLGYRIFTNTRGEASRFAGNSVSCSNCHLNAGQREKALPLVGVAGVFPEYNKRAGRLFSLEDRIAGCFRRSENSSVSAESLLHSKELLAVIMTAPSEKW